jgi:hypothetical protein
VKKAKAMAEESKPKAGARKTKAQHQKLAKLLGDGVPVCSALEQAGWAPTQAAKGYAKVPDAVLGMLPAKAQRLIQLGRETGKEDRKALIRGRLIDNATNGKDGGAMSAKILGSDSELNMWTPEQMTGVIVLQPPPNLNLTPLDPDE